MEPENAQSAGQGLYRCRIMLRGFAEPLLFEGYVLFSVRDQMFKLLTDKGKIFYFPFASVIYVEILEGE